MVCSKILITLDLDESVTYKETDGGTDQQTDGRTDALIGINNASEKFMDRYPTAYAQVHTCMWLHTHQ